MGIDQNAAEAVLVDEGVELRAQGEETRRSAITLRSARAQGLFDVVHRELGVEPADEPGREAGRGHQLEAPGLGVEQADGAERLVDVVLDRREQVVERVGHRLAGEDHLEDGVLGARQLLLLLALGHLPEVADDAPDRRLVELVRPGGLDPVPRAPRRHVELGDDGPVGLTRQLFEELDPLLDALVVEVVDEARPDKVFGAITAEDLDHRRAHIAHAPFGRDHDDDVGGVLHEGAEALLRSR